MKKINSILLSGMALLSTGVMTSCEDDSFLDVKPSNGYVAETYYASDDAVMQAIEPLYNYAWFNYNYRAIIGMGSSRANDGWNPYLNAEFAKFQVTDQSSELANAWSSFYMVVTMSNQLISDVKSYCTSDVSESVKNLAIGEGLLMRATAYFYLLRSWGPVIVFDDNVSMTQIPVKPLTKEEDVLKFIIKDLTDAIDYLPEASTDHHACKYAAEAMLAKVLLAQSGWKEGATKDHDRDEATLKKVVALCNDVINNGPYTLLSNYEDLWKYDYIDNNETVLAMRWADPLSGTWGTMNANYSDIAWSGISDVNVWGGTYASVDMLDLYNEDVADSVRLRATFFTPGRYYDYIDTGNDLVKSNEKTKANGYPKSSGYVYSKNHVQLKKYVVGTKADCSGHLAEMASPLNTYIMRFSDVYLIKAEAILGNQSSTSDAEGLAAINTVRARAGVKPLTSYDLETLIKERRKEFGMEFANWYDMVSWYRWRPQYMLNYFNNKQYRGFQLNENYVKLNDDKTISYCPIPPMSNDAWYIIDYSNANYKDGLYWWSDGWRDSDGNKVSDEDAGVEHKSLSEMCRSLSLYQPITLSEANIFMPYPETDVLRNKYFRQDPQSYDFGDSWTETEAKLEKWGK